MKKNKVYELTFRDMNKAAIFLANMGKKINSTGYFSMKDVVIFCRKELGYFMLNYPEALHDWDEAEFIGWHDIREVELSTVESTDTPGETVCVIRLDQPECIGDRVSQYILRCLNGILTNKEENNNE